jgi:polysaccharide chain length determinant protein (PEP-CTERM system associated)
MLGHRALTYEDYIAILRRRRWLLLMPALVLPFIGLGVTFLVPPQYVSQTLVLVEQQQIPDDYVKPIVSQDWNARLASMKEQILSRSLLQPIIERFGVYADRKVPMEERVDLTRKAISIKPIHSEAGTNGLPGFFIAFTATKPRLAQQVCGEISSLFVRENLRAREQTAEGTTDFLKGQLADAKKNLDDQDQKLAIFQRKYIGKLPGQEQPNMNMLTSLDTQLDATTQELARMQQDKSYEEAMLAQQTRDLPPPTQAGPPPEDRQAELDKMLAAEADLETRYTPDHPDVVALRHNIDELKRSIAKPAVTAAPSPQLVARPEPIQIQQLRAQLRSLDQGIADKKQEQARIEQQIGLYQDRIQSSPMVQEEFKQITRDYVTAQKFYDDLLTKKNHSEMAADLERRQQGEQFRVMDAPNLPEEPSFPKRWLFMCAGLVAGLCLGVMFTAFVEYRDTALRTERDVYAFTKLPTLGVISLIATNRTPQSAKQSKPSSPASPLSVTPIQEGLGGHV